MILCPLGALALSSSGLFFGRKGIGFRRIMQYPEHLVTVLLRDVVQLSHVMTNGLLI